MSDDPEQPPSRSFFHRFFHKFSATPKDRNDLVELLRDAQKDTLIKSDALSMMEGVLQVSEMQARDIMVPRSQMVVIEANAPLEAILPSVVESTHSRFPVIGDNRDDIEGILLAKELLAYSFKIEGMVSPQFEIRDLLRPAVVIPESKRLDILLKEFRLNRNHMAIVVDEYGGVSGLVTIEDVLEQIVGEIEDEFDVEEDDENIRWHNANEYTIKAKTPIEDFNETCKSNLDEQDFDTIGGLVVQAFGHLPARDESVVVGNFKFTVLHADNRRVRLLRAKRRVAKTPESRAS